MSVSGASRLFASVSTGPHVLTTDNLVYDGRRYRHDQNGIAQVSDNFGGQQCRRFAAHAGTVLSGGDNPVVHPSDRRKRDQTREEEEQ